MRRDRFFILCVFIIFSSLSLKERIDASAFDATRALPVVYQGRIRPLQAASEIWKEHVPADQHVQLPADSDLSPLEKLWFLHFAEYGEAKLNQQLFDELKDLNATKLPSLQISHRMQTRYPFAMRLKNAGSTLLMLPTRLRGQDWASLHALALKVYDPLTGEFIFAKNFTRFTDAQFEDIRSAYFSLKETFANPQSQETEKAATFFSQVVLQAYAQLLKDLTPSATENMPALPSVALLKLETLYTMVPLVECTLLFYILSLLVQMKPQFSSKSLLFLLMGYSLHSLVLLIRCLILQRPPVASMYDTIVYVPWIALTIGLIFRWLTRSQLVLNGAIMAAIVLLLILKFSYGDPHLENVQAVLNSPYWLTVHVLMVVGSYGAFALSGILGHYVLFTRRQTASKMILYTIYAGITLLIPGTILGGVWAAESWGRFWDWDPKESWAFISASLYLLIVHAYRFHKIAAFGLALGSVWGLMAISFTWYGVNYILGTGLHSYGFGNGGEWIYFLYLLAEVIFSAMVIFFHFRRERKLLK